MINFKYTVISGLPQDVSARIKYLILPPLRRKRKLTVLAVSACLSALNKYFRHIFLIYLLTFTSPEPNTYVSFLVSIIQTYCP